MNISKIEKFDWYEDYIVHWRPTNMCNYDCSYCEPSNHFAIDKNKLPDVNDLIEAAKKIRNSIPKDKTILVYITGGEPFLIKNVHEWFEWMSNNGMRVGIFTNGSLPLKIYELSKESFQNINIKISFHPEFGNVEKIAEFVKFIQSNNGKVEIRGMMAAGLFDKVFALENAIENVKVVKLPVFPLYNKTLNKVNPTHSSSRNVKGYVQKMDSGDLGYYTENELKILKSLEQETPDYLNITVNDETEMNAVDFVTNRINKFKNWKCGIVNKKILIEEDGSVKYGTCSATGVIGNIFSDDIKLFTDEWHICSREVCTTLDEIMVTKFKLN